MLVETVATSRPSWIVFFILGLIIPRGAIQEKMKSRLLSAQKKVDDVAFYLDKKK